MTVTATGYQWQPAPSSDDRIVADFYSDTKSKPTRGMLESILSAKLGDVQKGEDPTTNELCERVSDLLGKEAAILLPSGTMCNEIALRVHCNPGDEVICERSCHIYAYEAGGPAALSGIMMQPVDGQFGCFTADQVHQYVRPVSRYHPLSKLVSVEQTTNLGGGGVWSLSDLREVAEAAKGHDLLTHMDGARLLNASVASGVAAKDFTEHYDSCWIDLTKGLGGFAGAVLAGSNNFINQAWRIAQQWGGVFRQAGVIAATGLYALDNHVDRLADDHALAAHIADSVRDIPHVSSVLPCETNIVIFNIDEEGPAAAALVESLFQQGIAVGAFGERTVRIVTHLGVDEVSAQLLIDCLFEALTAE